MPKSILTVECYRLTEDDDNLESTSNSIEANGWLYTFYPLRCSLFDYAMLEGVSIAREYLFNDDDALHVEMQRIINSGGYYFSEFDGHHVIHLLTEEGQWCKQPHA